MLSRKSFTVEDVYFDMDDEENDIGVHSESYRSALWIYIGRKEEINIWNNLNRAVLSRYAHDNRKSGRKTGNKNTSSAGGDESNSKNNSSTTENSACSTRSESEESTVSERNFRQRYETVTHRLIHRKASIELYRRILDQTFSNNNNN